jgi:hypothetical protein
MDKLIDKLRASDSLVWARESRLAVRPGVYFSLTGMPYLADIIKPGKRISNVKKGTQLCLTTTNFVDDLHALYYRRYNQNIMYMMPTVKAVQKMCAVSFDPLINGNSHVFKKGLVTKNSSEIKTINGRTMSFVGGQPQKVDGDTKDSSNLRSDPCDRIDRDEIDLIDPDMVEMSKQRLQRSEFRIERNWGSPTTPNWGIDKLYDASDQRKWRIKCRSCEKHTCLGETFPDCILKVDGIWRRSCVHCGSEIYVTDGVWQTEYPERREAGFWVSGLLSPYCDLEDAMYRYETNDKKAEFMRSILGIATTDAECQLTHQAVRECCCGDGMSVSSDVRTAMGVDIGKKLHATVGIRTGRDQYNILSVAELDSYGELHDYAKKMNVEFTVMDSGPYDHGAREYQKSHGCVYLCYYSEAMPGEPNWDNKKLSIKCNRNEWCDKVYETYMGKKIVIPRESPLVSEYIRQLTCTEKTEITNDAGLVKPRWMKRGDDHFFHSTLYFLLAASRTGEKRVNGKEPKRFFKAKNNFHI